jgi:hypothetical protein
MLGGLKLHMFGIMARLKPLVFGTCGGLSPNLLRTCGCLSPKMFGTGAELVRLPAASWLVNAGCGPWQGPPFASRNNRSPAACAGLARTVPLKRLWLRDSHVNRKTCERKAVVEDPANCNKHAGTRYIDPDYMRKKGGQHRSDWKEKEQNDDQVDCCCWLCLIGCSIGASYDACADSSAGRHDHANRCRLRRW